MNHGQIVYNGSPLTVLDDLAGQVWQKQIE